MKKFLNEYFNISNIIENKREYKRFMKRVDSLPEDYRFVFKKIQNHMWQFCAGPGYDMMKVQSDLVELFELGAASGKNVLDITGVDVASFVEGLLENTRTYTNDWKTKLNAEINQKIKK